MYSKYRHPEGHGGQAGQPTRGASSPDAFHHRPAGPGSHHREGMNPYVPEQFMHKAKRCVLIGQR